MLTITLFVNLTLVVALSLMMRRYRLNALYAALAPLVGFVLMLLVQVETNDTTLSLLATVVPAMVAFVIVKAMGSNEKHQWLYDVIRLIAETRNCVEGQRDLIAALLDAQGEEIRSDYFLRGQIDGLTGNKRSVPNAHYDEYTEGLAHATIDALRIHTKR